MNIETCGFSSEELDSAAKVLRALSEQPDRKVLFRHPRFGLLRESLRRVMGSGYDKGKFKKTVLKEDKVGRQ